VPDAALAVIVLTNEEDARPLAIAERVTRVYLAPTGK
jgi:hypothetical protein